jgi:hypothetical protein
MYYILIGLTILIIVLLEFKPVLKKIQNKRITEAIAFVMSELNQSFTLKPIKKGSYDYELMIDHRVFYIKVISLHQKSLVITNKTTWIANVPGEPIIIEHRVKQVKEFIESTEKNTRIALAYPNVLRILKYINENEVVLIKPNEDVDGTRFIYFNSLNTHLKQLIDQ